MQVSRSVVSIFIVLSMLAGCAGRPTAQVLEPAKVGTPAGKQITLLAVTNRTRQGPAKGFGSEWAGSLTYESFNISVPPEHKISAIEYPTAKPDVQRQFVVTKRQQLSEKAFVSAATHAPQFDGTVALFVHGYNYSYQEALFRAAQIAADSSTPTAPILFSWPSQGAVAGYVADRDAVLYSRSELQSVVTALAGAKDVKRIILFGHSMGGFLVMEAVRQLKLQHRDDVTAKLSVILASPDIDVDVFRSQLRDVGRLPMPITLLVSKTDRALAVSSLLSAERPRIGLIDIDSPVIRDAALKENLRVIDISSVKDTDGLGHDRYAALAQFSKQLEGAERDRKASFAGAGAFVFDAAGAAVASPFRLAGAVISPR
jgi:esterase/lipase superfamily enzyme